jgi:glycosyltransferase involved in cell wall biosynthesis
MQNQKVVINIVDQLSSVNFGIWHAAIASAEAMLKLFNIKSVLVAPVSDFEFNAEKFPFVEVYRIEKTGTDQAKEFLKKFDPETTVVATHGAWQFPTKWGDCAKSLGFSWIYTPHGMLEPWSMSQKRLKKWIYFNLIESILAKKATLIRAVGKPEAINLSKDFSNVKLIANGIYMSDILPIEKPNAPIQILFLARLHVKKGIMPLLESWKSSKLAGNSNYVLKIAGTDDGELQKVTDFISQNPGLNVEFLGPQFGEEKRKLLMNSHFYILPSLSEGFPVSVIEAMAAGLVPIITKGCNFPEAFENGLGIETTQNLEVLIATLNDLLNWHQLQREKMAENCQTFVREHYTWEKIAEQQFKAFFPKV